MLCAKSAFSLDKPYLDKSSLWNKKTVLKCHVLLQLNGESSNMYDVYFVLEMEPENILPIKLK